MEKDEGNEYDVLWWKRWRYGVLFRLYWSFGLLSHSYSNTIAAALLGILKAIIWPAFLVFKVLEVWKM